MAGPILRADDAPPGVVRPALAVAALSAAALGLWALVDPPPANPHHESQLAYQALAVALSALLAGALSAAWSSALLGLARHLRTPVAELRGRIRLVQATPIALAIAFCTALFMPPGPGLEQDLLLLIGAGMMPQTVAFFAGYAALVRGARRAAGESA